MYSSSRIILCTTVALLSASSASSFTPAPSFNINTIQAALSANNNQKSRTKLYIFDTKEKSIAQQETPTATTTPLSSSPSTSKTVEETTEQYGLEAGLFQSLKQKDGGQSAKDLLAKYGVAYLATSIPLAIVSFAICYALVDNGVDVAGFLSNIGLEAGGNGEKVGTFAIAYAAHKAASPIRFPPTVILTPVVAKIIGKEPNQDDGAVDQE